MSLAWLQCLNDDQVKSILKRCNKLRELDLRGSQITNVSVDTIMSYLNPTLEELSLSYTNSTVNKLIELRCMSKLKSLNCLHLGSDEVKCLKQNLPQICVNQNIKIASMLSFKPQDGIWDIKVKQLKCGPSIMLQPKVPGISGSSFPSIHDFVLSDIPLEMAPMNSSSSNFIDYFSALKSYLQIKSKIQVN